MSLLSLRLSPLARKRSRMPVSHKLRLQDLPQLPQSLPTLPKPLKRPCLRPKPTRACWPRRDLLPQALHQLWRKPQMQQKLRKNHCPRRRLVNS